MTNLKPSVDLCLVLRPGGLHPPQAASDALSDPFGHPVTDWRWKASGEMI